MTTDYSARGCVFCLEAEDPGYANRFLGVSWPFHGRILHETETTFTVPGYGPQVFPYALVVTRRHIVSLAQATIDERRNIVDSLEYLREQLGVASGKLFVFEHAGCRSFDSCIEHFHLHVLDGKYDLLPALAGRRSRRVVVGAEDPLLVKGSYLLGGMFAGRNIEALVSEVESKEDQFFRRALARLLGHDAWDWRLGMNPEFMVKMMSIRSIRRRGEESVDDVSR